MGEHLSSTEGSADTVNQFKDCSGRLLSSQKNALRPPTDISGSPRRRAKYLEILRFLSQQMGVSPDMSSALLGMVDRIRDHLDYQQSFLYLTDENAINQVLRELGERSPDSLREKGLQLGAPAGSIVARAANTRRAVYCSDQVRPHCSLGRECSASGSTNLAIPLLARDHAIGVLVVQNDRSYRFDSEEIDTLQMIATQTAIAVENTRLFGETQARFDAVVALHETSLDIISELDKDNLLRALLRRGARLIEVETAAIFLYDHEHEVIYNRANYNTWRDWTGVTLSLGEGVTGQVILTGQSMIVNDYFSWPGKAEIFSRTTNPRVMGAPLAWHGQVIGALIVDKPISERPFDEHDLWLLTMFADLASIAIINADLHQRVKQFGQELERKVEERTLQLASAKEEIDATAEQLRLLLAKTIRIQEEERSRIARDIHDGVLQLASAVRYEIQAAKVTLQPHGSDKSVEKLSAARQVLDELESELRRVIYDLHPPALDSMGLVPCIEDHVHRFAQITGIDCDLRVRGNPYRLPAPVETDIYRILIEALQNVASHANSTSAAVELEFQDKALSLAVSDDGQGFDTSPFESEARPDHLGLLSMRQRAESIGGTMEVRSRGGKGTCVKFRNLGLHSSMTAGDAS